MLTWTPETIAFRADAARFVGFDEALAERIAALLPHGANVCEAGCGLGFLSLALARHGFRMTALDSDPLAVDFARRSAARAENPEILCCDAFSYLETHGHDALLLCFFGQAEEILHLEKAHRNATLIVIKKDAERHRFAPGENVSGHGTLSRLRERRKSGQLICTEQRFTLQMGQPFRSETDALRFFRRYGSRTDEAALLALLAPTDSREFPLFYSAETNLSLFLFPAGRTGGMEINSDMEEKT